MLPTKLTTPCPTLLITHTSTLSFPIARARLEAYIHKETSLSTRLLPKIRNVTRAEDLVQAIEDVTGGGDFIFFQEYIHNPWLALLTEHPTPPTVTYVFGNPLIARYILERNLTAGLLIPPRILLREHSTPPHSVDSSPSTLVTSEHNPNPATSTDQIVRTATTLQYHLPSSLLPKADLDAHPALERALENLDAKIEGMANAVLKVDEEPKSRL